MATMLNGAAVMDAALLLIGNSGILRKCQVLSCRGPFLNYQVLFYAKKTFTETTMCLPLLQSPLYKLHEYVLFWS